MTPANVKTLILGAGKSGVAAAKFLRARGAIVALHDVKNVEDWAVDVEELKSANIGLLAGEIPSWLLDQIELLIVSPGVPTSKNIAVKYVERKGGLVIGELELAYRFMQGKLIALTGSNGKTTTTSLTGHILKTAGCETFVGGNIGVPLISLVEKMTAKSVTVVEASSFQLETIREFKPHIATVLNITPDHLDRYDSFMDYAAAKHRIFRNQTGDDVAILNADDATLQDWKTGLRGRIVEFSSQRELSEGFFVSNGAELVRRDGTNEKVVATRDDTCLVGRHNLENICAALAMAEAASVEWQIAREAVRSFKPVEHRLELVTHDAKHDIRFYNDSKATNVDAAVKALAAFADDERETGKIVLIAGGQGKHAPYAPLAALLERCGRAVVTIGEDAAKIESELGSIIKTVRAVSMPDAVAKAKDLAARGDIVLLAPACASFDMFSGYDERGRMFKQEVEKLSC